MYFFDDEQIFAEQSENAWGCALKSRRRGGHLLRHCAGAHAETFNKSKNKITMS
jgi:hypothetical protein